MRSMPGPIDTAILEPSVHLVVAPEPQTRREPKAGEANKRSRTSPTWFST